MKRAHTLEFPLPRVPQPENLVSIPGVGPSIAQNLWDIGIQNVSDLRGQNPEELFNRSNEHTGKLQDRCLLYVFRCAVYYAETNEHERDPEKLNWWSWKDKKKNA